jgi:uncharacterized protein YcfJ
MPLTKEEQAELDSLNTELGLTESEQAELDQLNADIPALQKDLGMVTTDTAPSLDPNGFNTVPQIDVDPKLMELAGQAVKQVQAETQAEQARIAADPVQQLIKQEGLSFQEATNVVNQARKVKSEQSEAKVKGAFGAIPQVAGGVVGGTVGFGVGGVPGAVAGAVIGGGGGEAVKQIGQQLAGTEGAPQTSLEAAKRIGVAGVQEGAAEAIGQGVLFGAGKAISPLGDKVIPLAKHLGKKLERFGAGFTLGQITDAGLIDVAEEIGDSALVQFDFPGARGGSKRLKRLLQPRAFAKYTDDVVDGFIDTVGHMNPEQGGTLLLDTLEDANKVFRANEAALYRNVDKLTEGVKVNIKPVKDTIEEMLGKVELGQRLPSSVSKELKDILGLVDELDFENAILTRSDILDDLRKATSALEKNPKLARQLNKVQKMLRTQIKDTAEGLGGEALDAYNLAQKFTAEGKEQFTSKLITKLSKTLSDEPETFVRTVFKPKASKNVRLVKEVVGEDTFNKLSGSFLEDLIVKNSVTAPLEVGEGLRIVQGQKLLDELKNYGKPTLLEIFGKEGLKDVESIGQIGQIIQKQSTEKVASITTKGQLVAGLGLVAGDALGAAGPAVQSASGLILLSPPTLSLLMTDPKAIKLLANTINLSKRKGARGVAIGLARLNRTIARLEKEREAEQRKEAVEQTKSQALGAAAQLTGTTP